MKLVKVLSTVITEKSTPKSVLLEISDKLKKSLVSKFSQQTQDTPETIGEYIDEFEKYKNGLPANERDLSKYDYANLKKVIDVKKYQKKEKELFSAFKKKEDKLERVELAKTIRKFLEVQSKFGKVKDPSNYKFLDFSKLINQVYPKYIKQILMDKFKKENNRPIINNNSKKIKNIHISNILQNIKYTKKNKNKN
jgi:hypothetical protein